MSSVYFGRNSQDGDSLSVTLNATHREPRGRCAAELPAHLWAMRADSGKTQGIPRALEHLVNNKVSFIQSHSMVIVIVLIDALKYTLKNTEQIVISSTDYPATSNATDESVLTAHVRSWFRKPAGAKTKLLLRLGDPTTIKQKGREEEKMKRKERRVCDSSAASDACRHTVVSFKRLDVDSWLLSMAVKVLSWFTCSLTTQERGDFSQIHTFFFSGGTTLIFQNLQAGDIETWWLMRRLSDAVR